MKNRFETMPEWLRGYVAGIIDGEGTLGLYYSKRWIPTVEFTISNRDVAFKLRDALCFGGFMERPPYRKCKKTMYRVSTNVAGEVYLFLDIIRPYLIGKRRQAELLIEYCELKLTGMLTESDCQRLHKEICRRNS